MLFQDWIKLVDLRKDDWNQDIYLYDGYFWEDYAYRFSFPDIYDEHNYFNGILEICN